VWLSRPPKASTRARSARQSRLLPGHDEGADHSPSWQLDRLYETPGHAVDDTGRMPPSPGPRRRPPLACECCRGRFLAPCATPRLHRSPNGLVQADHDFDDLRTRDDLRDRLITIRVAGRYTGGYVRRDLSYGTPPSGLLNQFALAVVRNTA